MSETTLSADELDDTIPYVVPSQEDVYRVGWTKNEEEILSASEEEVVENRELWTHVVDDDRELAPYAHSEIPEEPDVEEIPSVPNQAKVMLFFYFSFCKKTSFAREQRCVAID